MPTYVSLFAGIGGLDLAMEAMGFECVAQVEIDPACQAVLARHWPDVRRWGDVSTYPGSTPADAGRRELQRRSDLGGVATTQGARVGEGLQRERLRHADSHDGAVAVRGDRPDLICGGFPCQPVSEAGSRKAQADARWLWPEFARVIRELGPRWVVVENVTGLLSAGEPAGSALGEILRDLAALGFDARWRRVRASDVGAPHRRGRIFLVAHAQDADGWIRTPREQGGEELRGRRSSGFHWGAYGAAIERWERVMGPAPHPVDDKGRLDPPFVTWMMGLPAGWVDTMTRTQALKALGNAVVPAQAYHAISSLMTHEEGVRR